MQANVESFMEQRLQTGTFWSAMVELGSTHPFLCKRVASLREFQQPGSMPPIGRNPFAYLFAPFTSVGGAAGGLGGLLGIVFVIGIIAAIAIPSLLRARVAANEAAAVGDAQAMIGAQEAFRSASGSYGSVACLQTPSSCIPNYRADGPVFLNGPIAQTVSHGYHQELIYFDSESFAWIARPELPGQTGIRVFCADARGVVCAAPSVEEAYAGSACHPACQILR
jgi:type II secretory pathway pseudopilin PulG